MTYFNKITINDPETEKDITVSPFRELKVVEATRLIGETFSDLFDPTFFVSASAGSGTATVSAGRAILATGATLNSSASLTTTKTARYLSSNSNVYRGIVRVPDTGSNGNVRRWGAFDINNGYFFMMSGTNFCVGARKAGVDTVILSSSFSNGTTTITTGSTVFEIVYATSAVRYYVGDSLVHRFNTDIVPGSNTPHLKMRAENINTGSITENITLEIRTASIYRLGKRHFKTCIL